IDQAFGVFTRDRTAPDRFRDFSYPQFVDLRDRAGVFDRLTALTFTTIGVREGEVMRQSFASLVSANYFDTLGVGMAAGLARPPRRGRGGGPRLPRGGRVAGCPRGSGDWGVPGVAASRSQSGVRRIDGAAERPRLRRRRRGAEGLRRHDDAGLARVVAS